ncbi:Kin of IRRE 3 protein [Rutstroemia sp. NJR-2017a BBW]|nr:Kin of IRRE 3 protein [Rutstroemia sp. NJR-2017a BBW]
MARQSQVVFESTWNDFPRLITLGKNYTLNYALENTVPEELQEKPPALRLCYATNYKSGLYPSNVAAVMLTPVNFTCNATSIPNGRCNFVILGLESTSDLPPDSTENAFFLCFADTSDKISYECTSYSPFFGIVLASSEMLKRQAPPTPSLIASTSTSTGTSLDLSLQTSAGFSVPSSIIMTQIGATTSLASFAQSSPISTTWVATSKSSSSGLSLGAKIGIAIGALGFIFLVLLAALFLIRRRRRNHPPNTSQTPENLLLSSPYQNNDSRDMFVAEKLARSSIQERETHTPLTSYTEHEHEHDTSSHQHLPLPGSAFTTNTPMPISPRRSQAATTVSRDASISVSRAVSDASHVSRPGSREIGIGERSLFDEAPYTDDVSRSGGGNLNVPKVYKGALQAPFLSEPGMSAEEVARLEEEERRIDEAIAEAEEERKRARMRSAGGG